MPNSLTHQYFGNKVLCKVPKLKTLLAGEGKIFDYATMGPDVMYGLKLVSDPVKGGWGEYVHGHHVAELFLRAARTLSETEHDKLWRARYAYAAGMVTHYVLDSRMHSYVYEYQHNRLVNKVEEDFKDDIHMLIETCFDYHVLVDYEGKSNKEKTYKRFQWNGKTSKAMQDFYNYALGDLFDFNISNFDRIFTTNIFYLVAFLANKSSRFKYRCTRLIERKTGFNHLLTAGYRTGLGNPEWDILNLKRRPFDLVAGGTENPSTETFDEVFCRAEGDAVQYLNAFCTAVDGDSSLLQALDFSLDYDSLPVAKKPKL